MNNLKYLSLMLCFAALALSCAKQPKGRGDATVGFRDSSLEVGENAGTVKIPLVFTGEASEYPIVFDVIVEPQGDFDVEEAVHITQTEGLRYMGNPDVPVYLECQLINDDVINEAKVLTLTISNINGATAGEISAMSLTINDNDNNPYDRLCGDWTFSATSEATGQTEKFPVKILGGFSADEEEENYEKVLVCWGFNGFMDDLTGNEWGVKPLHSPVWYLDYEPETKSLYLQNDVLMAGNFRNSQTNDFVQIKPCTAIPNGRGFFYMDPDTRLRATWSDDMKTITFNDAEQSGYGMACQIYTSDTSLPSLWSIHTHITLTQK
ncbi:MAG: hypothetical protein ACI4TM_08125 [Candidatus Cryptobacteroides sp.]